MADDGYSVQYNGFGSDVSDADFPNDASNQWTAVDIQSYKATPKFAPDGVTQETTQHVMSGTALIGADNEADFTTIFNNARAKLSRVAKSLIIKNGAEEIVKFSETDGSPTSSDDDGIGTPVVEFGIQRIIGHISALVTFSITWEKLTAISGDVDADVMSHVWRAEFAIDEIGLQDYTVQGTLRVRRNTGATGGINLGSNPDLYRGLIVPALPGEGFRVESMTFAVDEPGERLAYSVAYKQYARGLPGQVKKGKASFRWSRSYGSKSAGEVTKVFEGEAEGAPDVAPTTLLNQLVRVALTRINFGEGGDRIQEITSTEPDLFSRNAVGLRITSLTIGAGIPTADPGAGGTPGISAAGAGIGVGDRSRIGTDPLANVQDDYVPPSVYGSALVRAVQKALFRPSFSYNENTFPRAKTESADSADPLVYTRPSGEFGAEAPAPGADSGTESETYTAEHRVTPWIDMSVRERVQEVTGIGALKAQALGVPDIPYQHHGPIVILHSELEVRQHNKAPRRLFMDMPRGAILLSQDTIVTSGATDGNDNREFRALYKRTVMLLDIPGVSQGFENVTAGDNVYRVYNAPNASFRVPRDQRSTMTDTPGAVTDIFTSRPEYNFQLDNSPPFKQ